MHSPRPVSAESTLRGRTARALYHIPAGMCQKTPIRTDREGERTRIRTGGTINTSMPQHRNAKPAPSPAEQVRLPLQWCVYFRALRKIRLQHSNTPTHRTRYKNMSGRSKSAEPGYEGKWTGYLARFPCAAYSCVTPQLSLRDRREHIFQHR